jgi:hypothetical protein
VTDRHPRALCGWRPQKDDRQGIEEITFELSARGGERTASRHVLEAVESCGEGRTFGNRPPQQFDHLIDSVERCGGISGWPTLADEKAHVADDAVTDAAEPGQVDEEPFLEQRW